MLGADGVQLCQRTRQVLAHIALCAFGVAFRDGSDEVRMVWLLALVILNVLALLPYWLTVIRRHGPLTG